MIADKSIALVAKIERELGGEVVKVLDYEVLPYLNGRCEHCGAPCEFLNILLCDPCLQIVSDEARATRLAREKQEEEARR